MDVTRDLLAFPSSPYAVFCLLRESISGITIFLEKRHFVQYHIKNIRRHCLNLSEICTVCHVYTSVVGRLQTQPASSLTCDSGFDGTSAAMDTKTWNEKIAEILPCDVAKTQITCHYTTVRKHGLHELHIPMVKVSAQQSLKVQWMKLPSEHPINPRSAINIRALLQCMDYFSIRQSFSGTYRFDPRIQPL